MYSLYGNTNNPFNLRYSKKNSWFGQTGSYRGFAKFKDCTYGVRAGVLLLRNYIHRGFNTISSIITRFAPPSENDTANYITFVSRYVGIGRYVPLTFSSDEFCKLVCAILFIESHYIITTSEVKFIIERFKL